MKFSDISFKNKIYILLLLPILGFLGFSFLMIKQSYVVNNEMGLLLPLTELSISNSQLVHELQKERGATAGFLGSKGKKFVNEIREQRKLTDEKYADRNQFLTSNSFNKKTIIELNRRVADELNQLNSIRQRVNDFDIEASEAIGYYTNLNAKLLSVSSLIAEISTDPDITKQITAYYNFLQGKERAGIERAVMSNTFAVDKFTNVTFVKFISLVTEQNTYLSNFSSFSDDESVAEYNQQLNHPSVKEVERIRDIATGKMSAFNIDAVYWFKQATLRIGQLKKVENKLSDNLLTVAHEKEDSSFNILVIDVALTLVILTLVAFICVISIRDLMARVRELTLVMGKVRHDNDLTLRTTLEGESELGQISTALNLTLEQFSSTVSEISKSSLTLSAAAEETSTTCDINSTSMNEQQEGIALVAAAVEELSATVKEVASNTQLTADSAREANSQATNGLDVVKLSYSSIENLSKEIDGLAEQISNLHNSSNNITQVVDVIKSVADQTNLLALNAAIEAARAGEHGRGFAVVADEVRTLAQRTQDSTAEIESFITSLQSDANTAYNVIEDSQKKAVEAVEKSKNVEHTLEEITASVGHIFSMTEQIATAIEEQSVVTADVAQNIVTIEHKSTEAKEGATQIAITSREQTHLATSLQDLAGTFKI